MSAQGILTENLQEIFWNPLFCYTTCFIYWKLCLDNICFSQYPVYSSTVRLSCYQIHQFFIFWITTSLICDFFVCFGFDFLQYQDQLEGMCILGKCCLNFSLQPFLKPFVLKKNPTKLFRMTGRHSCLSLLPEQLYHHIQWL